MHLDNIYPLRFFFTFTKTHHIFIIIQLPSVEYKTVLYSTEAKGRAQISHGICTPEDRFDWF